MVDGFEHTAFRTKLLVPATETQRAEIALRTERAADLLPVLDKVPVDRLPKTFRQELPQNLLGFIGRGGSHQPPPVGDPVNMGVYTNGRLVEGK